MGYTVYNIEATPLLRLYHRSINDRTMTEHQSLRFQLMRDRREDRAEHITLG